MSDVAELPFHEGFPVPKASSEDRPSDPGRAHVAPGHRHERVWHLLGMDRSGRHASAHIGNSPFELVYPSQDMAQNSEVVSIFGTCQVLATQGYPQCSGSVYC